MIRVNIYSILIILSGIVLLAYGFIEAGDPKVFLIYLLGMADIVYKIFPLIDYD